MAYSTFQSVTGPTGPEGIKAVGNTGPTGNTGATGATGANAPYLQQYYWSQVDPTDGKTKAKLTFSDGSVVYVDGVTGQSGYKSGVTADGVNLDSSGRIFKQTTGTDGVTFQFRGITATDDLTLNISSEEIAISGSAGISTGYVDSGSTGEFLHLSTTFKAEGGSGSFYGPSADGTGTGDTIQVKFRNVSEHIGDEFNLDFCGTFDINESGDEPREYILDVSQLCRYTPPGNQGKKYGYICIGVKHFIAKDRIVILRTKVNASTDTQTLKLPLYGASEVNFADPISGEVLYIAGENDAGEGYGNTSYRRSISNFNTPYENTEEGYEAGPHPLFWNGDTGASPIDCPTEQAIIFDTDCVGDSELDDKVFRGKSFCTNPDGSHSYCVRIEEDYFESQNINDPWYGKIRLVVLPGCESAGGISTAYEFTIGCESTCSCGEGPNGECCYNNLDCDTLGSSDITGRVELDITNANFFKVKAPIQLTGFTWDYEPRPGMSIDTDNGVDYAETKNITIAIEGGPNNIKFPSNVKFAGTPTFTNGIDIVNLLTIDNGETWFATLTGYGWDVDVFKSDYLGSCCHSSVGCVNFVSEKYCSDLGGVFEEGVACWTRTDSACGGDVQGACCTGVNPDSLDGSLLCDPNATTDVPCDEIFGEELGTPNYDETQRLLLCISSPGCQECCNTYDNRFPWCDLFDEGLCTTDVGYCCANDVCFPVNYPCQCAAIGGRFDSSCEALGCAGTNCCVGCPLGCIETSTAEACSTFASPLGGGPTNLCDNCSTDYPDIYETVSTQARPICLQPSTLLQCNLINGYFVQDGSQPEGQQPCDVCATINACDPPKLGTCCDRYNGTCYGIMFENQCSFPTAEWHPDTEDCDICCPEQQVFGACCQCDDNCTDQLTPQDCASIGGVFMGIDTTCAASNCSVAGACPCECNSNGCCDCPPGHPSRSPCCDQPDSPECCSPGNDCCPFVDPCCDSSDPDCDGGPGPEGPSVDDTETTRGEFGFGDISGPGPGGIDPRSEWNIYSCCFGPGACSSIFVPSREAEDGEESFDPNVYANELCEAHGGEISLDPCWMSCQYKFTGACCCVNWTLDCSPNDPVIGTDGCSDCVVKDYYISCNNCEFNGNIGGVSRPWDGISGPYKPINPDVYPIEPGDVFDPGATGAKRKGNPGTPYFLPDPNNPDNPIRIPFDWRDCCQDKGGCGTKPCTLEERITLYTDYQEFLDPTNCPASDPFNTDPCNDPTHNYADLAEFCGHCDLTVCSIDGACEPTGDNGVGVSFDDIIKMAERSSCTACDCVPNPPLCTPGGLCEDLVFSSCRFVYDETQLVQHADKAFTGANCEPVSVPTAPNGQPNNGNNGSFRNNPNTQNSSSPSTICTQRADEIWGPCLKDRGTDTTTPNPLFPDGSGVPCEGNLRTPQFRNINNNVVPTTSRVGTSKVFQYTIR